MALTQNLDQPAAEVCGSLDWWCSFTQWTLDFLTDIVEVFTDIVAWVFDQLLSLFVFILSLLPDLSFLALDWSGLAPIMYFADRLSIDVALGIYGAGLVFRLTRKFFTFGQW